MERAAFYRTLWRWHFYAGLFVVPFILILSLTGAAYLFKPQIEQWEEARFDMPSAPAAAVAPSAQVAAALAAVPGARFDHYRLPAQAGGAAMVHVSLPGDAGMRDVFVTPDGRVTGQLDPEARIPALLSRIHGQLLMGKRGSWIVELAASWAIVLVLTGLYLWWPRGRGLAGVVWPRLSARGRPFWRDLHAVTGFWVSGLALVLLVTAMPWADVWGNAFKAVRAEMGWTRSAQDWTLGGQTLVAPGTAAAPAENHAEHDHGAMAGMDHGLPNTTPAALDMAVRHAANQALAFPVIVRPPAAGASAGASDWGIKSEAQNRPERVTIRYDASTNRELSREGFADKHIIDRVVGYGIAWHEGALFGWINQLIGLATALALVLLAVSGVVMWWRRRPVGELGAPRALDGAKAGGFVAILLGLAVVLPLLALSLMVLWLSERVLVRIAPGVARWLGVAKFGVS